MSTWEERMSQRTKERARQLAFDQGQRFNSFSVMLEPQPPKVVEPQYGWMSRVPGHEGHVDHFHGTSVVCSCRTAMGVATVAFPEDWVDPEWCGFCDAPYDMSSGGYRVFQNDGWVG